VEALPFAFVVAFSIAIGWAIRLLAADRPILGDVLRYRGPVWPSGVQEDDDARWNWRRRRADPAAPVAERLHAKVRPSGPR
jgi:hypothetical protein